MRKLNEEDEFKPTAKKSPLENKEIMQLVKTSTNFSSKPPEDKQLDSNSLLTNIRRAPVEIVGIGTTNGFQSGTSNGPYSVRERSAISSTTPSTAVKNDFTLDSTLAVSTIKPHPAPITKPGESLTEKNYLLLIDNLTSRYGGSQSDATTGNTSTSAKNFDLLKKVKNTYYFNLKWLKKLYKKGLKLNFLFFIFCYIGIIVKLIYH